ncbi:hypothetical protein MKX01_005946 [Papaver californicum]|nr:hypothetical protein MKX01_005946 [Papaver californicum]
MAERAVDVAESPKRRTLRKFAFRGADLDQLLDMGTDKLVKIFTARAGRRFQRGLEDIHTHNMIIVPEMIGSIVGVYNGKTFNQFSISYKIVKHGRPGIRATHSSRFIPLK